MQKDAAGHGRIGLIQMKTRVAIIVIVSFSLVFAGCGNERPVAKKAVPPSPTPIPADAVKVDKPVNVSFSTYSKEWPVGWQWIDPDEKDRPTPKDVKKGVLRVQIPSGKDLYGENRTAPRYIKPITGDFEIETRVKFLPKENYQGAGLLIYLDGNNYMRFERAYGGIGGGGEGIRIDVRESEEYRSITTPNEVQTEAPEIQMKIIRSGPTFSAYWRIDEESEWREAGVFESKFPETIFAGLVACNTAREIEAEFGYIKLLPKMKELDK
jgi:regulation of enolase protein 1 (concanavalin A-like superfamily)